MRNIIYYALAVLVLAYAFARGGKSERAGALIVLVGSLLTDLAIAPGMARFVMIEFHAVAVDVAALAAFVILALLSDRYWPYGYQLCS